uniref:Uncharacterized protein n=1 Tax=Poecilia latipinna TaxID=48699 RepID=A0A3B3TQ83_9TELE
MKQIICEKIDLIHHQPELLLPSDKMQHSRSKTTNQTSCVAGCAGGSGRSSGTRSCSTCSPFWSTASSGRCAWPPAPRTSSSTGNESSCSV